MTKKDYEKLAKVLYSLKPAPESSNESKDLWLKAVKEIGRVAYLDNQRFDWGKWNVACGVNTKTMGVF